MWEITAAKAKKNITGVMLTVLGSEQQKKAPSFSSSLSLSFSYDDKEPRTRQRRGFQSPSLNITEQSREVLKLKEMV